MSAAMNRRAADATRHAALAYKHKASEFCSCGDCIRWFAERQLRLVAALHRQVAREVWIATLTGRG